VHIILTICSANYLAHAKTLGDSILEHNPEAHFVIGIVDVLSTNIDMTGFQQFEILDVAKTLPEEVFKDLLSKYYLVELNTAVKPFLMDYLYQRYPSVETVSYFDPDIRVYSSLSPLFVNVHEKGIIVTPHGCTYDDSSENIAGELSMLAVGIYNLGFIATARSDETVKFLRWWMLRLKDHCTYRPDIPGTFFDQNWVMLAGLYFNKFYVEKNPGYNLAWWNLFERRISLRNGVYFVNEQYPLVFIHFSAFKPEHQEYIAYRVRKPIGFDKFPELKSLFEEYRDSLLENGYAFYKSMVWGYARYKERDNALSAPKQWAKSILLLTLSFVPPVVKIALIGLLKKSLNSNN